MSRRDTALLDLLAKRFGATFTREQLLAKVLAGAVTIAGETVRDPRRRLTADAQPAVQTMLPMVSRGGAKLANALTHLDLDVSGLEIIDTGSSTGGFTDCLLRAGASRVYAIDSGRNQLHHRIRSDPRVQVMEETPVLQVSREMFPRRPHAAVMDLSFRSLRQAAAHVLTLVEDWCLSLAKPQFEWINPPPEFDGVVRSDAARQTIIASLLRDLEQEGVFPWAAHGSKILGREGNRECFFLFQRQRPPAELEVKWEDQLKAV